MKYYGGCDSGSTYTKCVIIDENGAFDISKCGLISYANGGYYAQGEKLGKFGFSVQKKK